VCSGRFTWKDFVTCNILMSCQRHAYTTNRVVKINLLAVAIVWRAKYTHMRTRSFEETDAKGAPKIRDKAREFELSAYIPSAKLWLALSPIPVNNLATVHKSLSTLVITVTAFQFTEIALVWTNCEGCLKDARIGRKVQNYIRFSWRLFVQAIPRAFKITVYSFTVSWDFI